MLIQAEIWTVAKTDQGNAVLLRPLDSEVAVPIFIGQLEAQSILIGMAHVPMPRPNTHELMISLLNTLDYHMNRIEITEIKEGVFYASLHIQSSEGEVIQDSRPSDALALAVRAGCPIYLSDMVVDEAGIPLETIIEESSPQETDTREVEIMRMKNALKQAIKNEDYEEAARLRDLLENMDPSDSSEDPPAEEF